MSRKPGSGSFLIDESVNLVRKTVPDLVHPSGPDLQRSKRKEPKPEGDRRSLADRADVKARYSTVPWDMLVDCALGRMKSQEVLVFAVLAAEAIKTDKAAHSTRWLAENTGLRRERVMAALKKLASLGHIKAISGGTRARQKVCWRMTSLVFARKQQVIVVDADGTHKATRATMNHEAERLRAWRKEKNSAGQRESA